MERLMKSGSGPTNGGQHGAPFVKRNGMMMSWNWFINMMLGEAENGDDASLNSHDIQQANKWDAGLAVKTTFRSRWKYISSVYPDFLQSAKVRVRGGDKDVVAAAGKSTVPARIGAPPLPPTLLAPGFRFHPTDEELVRYYLRRKVCGKPFRFQAVTEIDVYKSEPWELGDYSALKTRDMEWYFFSPVDKKYGSGSRLNRATGKGHWKATGKERSVRPQNETIAMKKILVYYSGLARKRTNWVMHEYRLCDPELESAGIAQDAFVLCKIFEKSGLGPPNGDQYAPFLEEEWDEDAPIVIPDADDDVANVDEAPAAGGFMDLDQAAPSLSIAPPDNAAEAPLIPYKRDSSGEPDPLSVAQSKRARHDDPNCSRAVGLEDSTSSQGHSSLMRTKNSSSPLLEFPLLEPRGQKESSPSNATTFDSSTLEKSVPAGYLKFIGDLENEIFSISKEKETLKIELMRAQARISMLEKENDNLRRRS